MSRADGRPGGREQGRTPSDRPDLGRKRGRIVISGVIAGAVLLVFAFMLLVSRCGGDGSEVYGAGVLVVESESVARTSAV
ncbi:MAG: hypothetical protein JWR45_1222 [Blastococcus sp.]|nr:hypothetical protein [Blastococcus sp.]